MGFCKITTFVSKYPLEQTKKDPQQVGSLWTGSESYLTHGDSPAPRSSLIN